MRARDRRIPDGRVGIAAVKVGSETTFVEQHYRGIMNAEKSSLTPATLDIVSWHPTISPERTDELARSLEAGGILVLPKLAFVIAPGEARFLDTKWSDAREAASKARAAHRKTSRNWGS